MAPGESRLGYTEKLIGGINGAMTEAQEPKRNPLINMAMQELHSSVTTAREAVGYLIERLHPIMMPEPSTAGEGKSNQIDQVLPPLAEDIRGMTRALENVVKVVNYTISRLEI